MSLNQELIKKFQKNLSNNIKLSNYSWFNLGGPAEYLFKPKNKEQLIEFLKENKKSELNLSKKQVSNPFLFVSYTYISLVESVNGGNILY